MSYAIHPTVRAEHTDLSNRADVTLPNINRFGHPSTMQVILPIALLLAHCTRSPGGPRPQPAAHDAAPQK